MKMKFLLAAILAIALSPLAASATPVIVGSSSGTTITGYVANANPFDSFTFSWGGGLFTASTNYAATTADTWLFLLNPGSPDPIADHDDINGASNRRSLITVNSLAAGIYEIVVTGFPVNVQADGIYGGKISRPGNYELSLAGVDVATVVQTPESSSLLLLGTGLLGLAASLRFRKAIN